MAVEPGHPADAGQAMYTRRFLRIWPKRNGPTSSVRPVSAPNQTEWSGSLSRWDETTPLDTPSVVGLGSDHRRLRDRSCGRAERRSGSHQRALRAHERRLPRTQRIRRESRARGCRSAHRRRRLSARQVSRQRHHGLHRAQTPWVLDQALRVARRHSSPRRRWPICVRA